MIYRLAAALALALELLHAAHLLPTPLLQEAPPLALTGAMFISAFVLSEVAEVIGTARDKWR